MATYLLAYHGGGMPDTPEERAATMALWNRWYDGLGEAVIDVGNPIARRLTIGPAGAGPEGGGADPVTGYSILEAADLEEAAEMARGCPILAAGGRIEIGETYEAM